MGTSSESYAVSLAMWRTNIRR